MARQHRGRSERRQELDVQERAQETAYAPMLDAFDSFVDDETAERRAFELAKKPSRPGLPRLADFSCQYPACEVRTSRITDPGVVYSRECQQWFCSASHRDAYMHLRRSR